jgi:ribosomal-protein-alanine N-acetyltransferase
MTIYNHFETERLNLDLAEVLDAPFFLTLFNSPSWIKYIGDRNVHTLEEAENYIESRMVAQQTRLGYGNYVLRRKEDGVIVGVCGLYDRPAMNGVDIGYALLEQYEGNGYASEAALKLYDVAKNILGLSELKAFTLVDHKASQRILYKIGMKPIKTFTMEGEDVELLLFG